MSDPNNPYGPPSGNDPYGQNPYGQQPGQNPYGQQPEPNPYGQPAGQNPYGQTPYPTGGAAPAGTDTVSIIGLVLSFLCCLAPIGVIMGFIGLGRTKNGQRKGRGLAIAAIAVGIVMTLITAGLIVLVIFAADQVITPSNAEVGQCANVKKEDDTVLLTKAECSDKHDAEIVGVAEVTDDNLDQVESGTVAYCATVVEAEDLAKLLTDDDLSINAVIQDPDDINVGDTLVCYAQGTDLTGSLL